MPDQLHLSTASTPEPEASGAPDRKAYRQRLREALRNPAFRATEGFPIGSDEAILALSDPPHYTACPNPFLPEILARWQEERRRARAEGALAEADDRSEKAQEGRSLSPTPGDPETSIASTQVDARRESAQEGRFPIGAEPYHREPFAADVSEGKNDPIYNAHSYHTKVPHRAIMRYILHYTDPGDIVLDGFCGTGMTGVAAQLCADKKAVESLGYRVADDGTILDQKGRPFASLGAWYRQATDLGAELRAVLRRVARRETQDAMDAVLTRLEEAWAAFVKAAHEHGLLAADLDALLSAYEALLSTAADHLHQEQEVHHSFRWLVQAWMVGPETFDEWAIMPLLHPLKLHWYRARARRFSDLLARLLSPKEPAPIVDVRRFRQELTVTYGSAGHPTLVALPGKDRRPAYFLPVHEMQGYELFHREGLAGLAYGLDPDLVSEDESEEAAEVAAVELARVVQDYIETYPFARDGLEIYILQCRNGALPGLLVERLDKLARRRKWSLHLTVVVHSTDRGAPLYLRVTEWLKAHEEFIARPNSGYFPPVSLRVLECSYDDLFQQVHDTDLVILPDVLAEKGQAVESDKTNLPARIAFRLPSHHDSMTILDQSGAENLLGKGDMLFRSNEGIERLQGFYISPAELMELLSRWHRPD